MLLLDGISPDDKGIDTITCITLELWDGSLWTENCTRYWSRMTTSLLSELGLLFLEIKQNLQAIYRRRRGEKKKKENQQTTQHITKTTQLQFIRHWWKHIQDAVLVFCCIHVWNYTLDCNSFQQLRSIVKTSKKNIPQSFQSERLSPANNCQATEQKFHLISTRNHLTNLKSNSQITAMKNIGSSWGD